MLLSDMTDMLWFGLMPDQCITCTLSAIANILSRQGAAISAFSTHFPSLQPAFLYIITPINYSLGMKLRKLRENCLWAFGWTPVGICKQPEDIEVARSHLTRLMSPFFFGPCFVLSPRRYRDSRMELLCLHRLCMPIPV